MAEIKRFFDCFVPVSSCNLRCNYCYVAQHPLREEKNRFLYTAEEIGSALARKRFGGICCFNLCGSGETLYPSATIAIVRSILQEGHFVNIITNGTMTGRLREFLTFPEAWKQHLFIKFSYHYLELRDRHLTEIFFRNFNLLRENGISVSLEITADDNYVPHIPAIQQEALEHAGALPHVSIPRIETKKIPLASKYSLQELENQWSSFQSAMFTFKKKHMGAAGERVLLCRGMVRYPESRDRRSLCLLRTTASAEYLCGSGGGNPVPGRRTSLCHASLLQQSCISDLRSYSEPNPSYLCRHEKQKDHKRRVARP